MAEFVEHVEGFAEGMGAVGVEPVVREVGVEQAAMGDEGKVALAQIGKPLVDLGDAGYHDAVGAAGFDDMPEHRKLGLALRGGEDEVVPRDARPSPRPVTNSPRKESTRLGPRIGSTMPIKPLRPETRERAAVFGT